MPEGSPDAPAGDPTPTETTTTPLPASALPTADTGASAEELARLKVEVEKWRALSRGHEEQSSKTVKELEKLRRQTMTDQEKAVAEAQDAGYKLAVSEFGGKLVDAEIRTLAAGRLTNDQLAVLLQGLNRQVFLLDDGSVDAKSVQTFVDGLAPKPQEPEDPPKSPQFPDLGQGVRGQSPALNGDPLLAALKRAVGAP